MRFLTLFLTSLFLVADVLAYSKFDLYDNGFLEIRACHMALFSSAIFCPGQTARGYKCYCTNKNAMASLAGCAKIVKPSAGHNFDWYVKYCHSLNVTITEKNITDSLVYLNQTGKNFTAVKASSSAASGNSTSGAKNATTTSGNATSASNSTASKTSALASGSVSLSSGAVASGNATKSNSTASSAAPVAKGPTKIDYPIYVNQTSAILYHRAYKDFLGNFDWAYWFSTGLYAYWALVFLVGAACNWSVVLFPNLRNVCNGKISKAWRKYVTLPALIKKKKNHHQKFLGILNFLVPSRLESLILSGFFWLTFLFNALKIGWSAGNPVFVTRYAAILRYVSDRTGVIGTMLIPLLILTAGRNNFLQWFTRWKYSTFILYHRWIGRVVVALVFVHSMGYSMIYINRKTYLKSMKREFIIYGVVGTVAGGLICFQGLLFLRRKFYEVFLIIHIMMAVAFILGTWKHIETESYMAWLFASIAIWSFDRFVRLVRMASFGVPKATVTLLADDCLRVVVPKPKYWPSIPGGHAWVYFCHSWYFWQSHPFTFLDSTVEQNKIVFILKTKKGATNYLTKKLSKLPGKTCSVRVCVEGPYGEACSVKGHDNVVFVAGGNGIPGIFSECYDLARRSVQNAKQRVKLVWVLREISTIEWVWEELHSLKNTKVQTTVYITRPEGGNEHILLERMATREDTSSSEEKEEKDSFSKEGKDIIELLSEHFPHITFKAGRPSMEAIVDEETEEAAKSAAFITCGHPIMVDDLRYAVVQKIDKTEKRVDFFEQLQVWA
ncbi:hypothetical protein JCM33374_g2413 [Metschnikowia sp. JCM 33374]|nr:hypothetical protein JCM33374_g2413 [Metschnikowia sp. JCM 33374]